MKLKKGDTVKILSGTDRGKTGKVLSVVPEEGRLTVEGVNVFKKRVRPKAQGQKGETVLVPRPLSASKVMLVCQNCKMPSRTGERGQGRTKERFCKKCQATT